MNNNRNRISAIFMSIFIVISFFFMMGCSIVCAQENNETDTPLAVGVLLNKPDVTYDISPLEKFAEDGSVYIYKSDNVIMENVDNSNRGTFRSEDENPIVPGIKYIYRSHFNSNLGVVIYGRYPSLFPDYNDDTEMNNLDGLVVNIVIPTKLEQVPTEWEQVTLELFYEVKVNETILNFMENLGYYDSGGGTFGDSVGLYFTKGNIKINIASIQNNGTRTDPMLSEVPGGYANFTLTVDGPKAKFDENLNNEIKNMLNYLNVDPNEWDNATRITLENFILESVPSVPIEPETFAWGAAISTELQWLINQSIISGLTDNDLAQIDQVANTERTGQYTLIYYSNDIWIWFPYLLLGGDTFGESPMVLNINDLPDRRPGEDGYVPTRGFPYFTLGIISTVVILLALGTFSYSRLKRRSILDNLNRKNIFELIKKDPGIHFKKILRELNFKPGALSYHLNVLEKEEYIKSIQDGNYRRFYLFGAKSDFKIMLTSIQLRILSVVDERPGISQTKISDAIGKNRMIVNYHVKILMDAGILSLEKSGRESQCFTTGNAEVYLTG